METVLLMPSATSSAFIQERIKLPPCRVARITHRHIHILVRMVTLRIMTHNDISSWKMDSNRNVVHISLMMVSMPPFYRHRTVHHRRVKL
jgi:hypothetical protein